MDCIALLWPFGLACVPKMGKVLGGFELLTSVIANR
jgi:hypothetical protein